MVSRAMSMCKIGSDSLEVLTAEMEKSGSDATRPQRCRSFPQSHRKPHRLGEEVAAHVADIEGAKAEKEDRQPLLGTLSPKPKFLNPIT